MQICFCMKIYELKIILVNARSNSLLICNMPMLYVTFLAWQFSRCYEDFPLRFFYAFKLWWRPHASHCLTHLNDLHNNYFCNLFYVHPKWWSLAIHCKKEWICDPLSLISTFQKNYCQVFCNYTIAGNIKPSVHWFCVSQRFINICYKIATIISYRTK